MELDKVAVAIRPRNHWEAIDLGFKMTRELAKPVYVAWLSIFVPVVVFAHVVAWGSFGWAILIVWWSKPLLDRVVLIVLSRAVFGATPTVGEALRELAGIRFGDLIHALTIARLDPGRSFTMPVWLLEGLRGKARRQRINTLKRRTSSASFWHTMSCWHLESVLAFGMFLLAIWMVPEQYGIDWEALFTSEQLPEWLLAMRNGVYVLAVAALEPFFVAGGFSLYLNRRTVLEGWDIELTFRRMAPRISTLKGAQPT